MRRTRGSLAVVLSVLVVAVALAGTPPALAEGTGSPNYVSTTWDQPGPEPLDGLGFYLYVAPQPVAAAQLASDYDYIALWQYENQVAPGAIGLGSGVNFGGGRGAGFATGGSATVSILYDWAPGKIYFLLAHRLAEGQWGGWVLDVEAAVWTFIGTGTTPPEWGKLAPRTQTVADWEDQSANAACDVYPRTDAYATPVVGIRGGTFTLGSLVGYGSGSTGCPSEASDVVGWSHYRLGT